MERITAEHGTIKFTPPLVRLKYEALYSVATGLGRGRSFFNHSCLTSLSRIYSNNRMYFLYSHLFAV